MFKRKAKVPKAPRHYEPSPAIATILRLLEQPDDWAFGEHYATHIGGAKIWIANPDCIWARAVTVPGLGAVLPQGRDCHASDDHKAVDAATWAAQQATFAAGMTKYVLGVESERERRNRAKREEARRVAYDAERLAAAAEEARLLSVSMLAEMEPKEGSGEAVATVAEGEGSREELKP